MADDWDNLAESETGPIGDGSDHNEKSGNGPGPAGTDLSGRIVGDASGAVFAHAADSVPRTIGPYRIHGPIGRGGMGTVYKASHDTNPGRKLVAIKLVKRGLDTEEILQRFEVERQVMSGLAHPYIARFFEAGETEEGRPYFVMEYIEGQQIMAYCDANNLSLQKRLELFRKVCEAVHHAHTNLVVHRDLKPDNIVVTLAGEPKLLDFGIAKILNPNLARVVAVTGPAIRLMTPEYASPEQVRGQPISTLSDVYSLGVLLYELLSGHRPYQIATRLEEEIIRVICESDPVRPSTAVNNVEEAKRPDGTTMRVLPETIAQKRGGNPATIRRLLLGDLDDIILHAMSKAPAQRYPSAMDMSDDLAQYLSGNPVAARRARRRSLYVTRKFIKRHRTAVTAALASFAVIVVMGTMVLRQSQEQLRLKTIAAESALEAAEAKNRDLVRSAFGNVLWEQFSNRIIDVNLPPESREALWTNILESFSDLRNEHGQDSPIVLEQFAKAMKELGDVLGGRRVSNVGDTQGAMRAYTESSRIFEKLAELQPQNEALLYQAATSLVYKGDIQRELNRSQQASATYAEAERLYKLLPADGELARNRERALYVVLLNNAQMAGRICEIAEATKLCCESVALREQRANREPETELWQRDVAIGHVNLGEILLVSGDAIAAEESFRRALAVRRGLLDRHGPDPRRQRDVAVSSLALSIAMTAQDRHEAAARLLDEAETGFAALVAQFPTDAGVRDLLCQMLIARAENHLAADQSREALVAAENAVLALDELERRAPDKASNERMRSEIHLLMGRALLEEERPLDARPHLDSAMNITESLLAIDPERSVFRRRLATVALAMGRVEMMNSEVIGTEGRREAVGWYRRAAGMYQLMEAEGRLCGVSEEDRAAAVNGANDQAP